MQRELARFLFRHRSLPKRLISELAPNPVLLNLGTYKMYVRLDDWAVGARIAIKHTYEPHVTRVISRYLHPGAVVLDIGANIGYYTLLAAAAVGETGQVIAFEPSTDNCALLAQSVARNYFHNVTIYCQAAADRNCRVAFGMDDSNGGISVTEPLIPTESVEAVVLDTVLQDGPRVDLVKMDIEGAEGLALRGMKEYLRRHRPVLVTEFSPYALAKTSHVEPEEYLEELRGLGYDLHVISREERSDHAPHSNQEIMEQYTDSESDHIDIEAVHESMRRM